MMEKKNGVAQQILKEQPTYCHGYSLSLLSRLVHLLKEQPTYCHGYSLSLSIKDANILIKTMGTAGWRDHRAITLSPKREQMLGAINKNIEVRVMVIMTFLRK